VNGTPLGDLLQSIEDSCDQERSCAELPEPALLALSDEVYYEHPKNLAQVEPYFMGALVRR
jgi:hypothetical protein